MKYLIYTAVVVIVLLFIMFISIVFLVRCTPAPQLPDLPEVDRVNVDSLADLTNRSIEQHNYNQTSKKLDLDSLEKCLHLTERTMSAEKNILLRDIVELNVIKRELYSELRDYKSGKIITKDTIIYNIKHKDTTIMNTIILYDTITRSILIKNRER